MNQSNLKIIILELTELINQLNKTSLLTPFIKQLNLFPIIINEAATTYSPSLIANYLYELVKTYNHFYQSVKINIEPNESLKMNRLKISLEVSKIIKKSLNLLGIEAPYKM